MATEAEKAAELAKRDRVLSVYCPICMVRPGERCRDIFSQAPSNVVHEARVILWRRHGDD